MLGWDAWAGDSGIKHANAVELGGTPESAVTRAMERAVQKYGPQEWSGWEFRAEPVPKTSGAAGEVAELEGLHERRAAEDAEVARPGGPDGIPGALQRAVMLDGGGVG